MARIAEDKRHVVMPQIDSIDPDSFAYELGGIDILAFSWTLGQKDLVRDRSEVEPMQSPVMAGGLFAIDRQASD
jgi:polypeptide N-acetylgalactosaminyltransferase